MSQFVDASYYGSVNVSRNWTYGPFLPTGARSSSREAPFSEGVRVHDSERHLSYRVTLLATPRGPRVRTLEVIPDDPDAVLSKADLGRVPLVTLAEYAALYLDKQHAMRDRARATDHTDEQTLEALGEDIRSHTRTLFTAGGLRTRYDIPDSTTLARMIREEGFTRTRLAKHFGRAPSTISDWIGRAYREVPELMPPRGKGRRPASQGADEPATGRDKEGDHEHNDHR